MIYADVYCHLCGEQVCQTCGCCHNPNCDCCSCPESNIEDDEEETDNVWLEPLLGIAVGLGIGILLAMGFGLI